MSGLPGLKHTKFQGRRYLSVDIPPAVNTVPGAGSAPGTAANAEPSPYGQPFVMPPSLRGTKRDHRSPRYPHSAREPATRKRKAAGGHQHGAEASASGWNEPDQVGPAKPAQHHHHHHHHAAGQAMAPGAPTSAPSTLPNAAHGTPATAPDQPLPPAAERSNRPHGGGWVHAISTGPACSGVRSGRGGGVGGGSGGGSAGGSAGGGGGPRRVRSSRSAFTKAARLYQKQPMPQPPSIAKLPPMAGGHVNLPKPPPTERDVGVSTIGVGGVGVGGSSGGSGRGRPSPTRRTRSTSPTDRRQPQHHVEPLSEAVHIWHPPALAEPRPPSRERSSDGARPGGHSRLSPGRSTASRPPRDRATFQSRYISSSSGGGGGYKPTDMEIESASARMAQLRVTPRGDEQAMAWMERPTTAAHVSLSHRHLAPTAPATARPQTAQLPPIFVLPAELMILVLRHLSHLPDLIRVSAVCKRMRQVAFHRRLWRHVDFRDDPRITPQFLHAIAVRNPRMSKLSVQSCKNVNDRAIFAVASACHSLREIDVSDCPYVTFQTLNVILGSLSELRTLNASGCEKNVELIVTRTLPKLQEVLISDCDVDDATALSIASRCPNLRKLDVSGSTLISSKAISALARCSKLCSLSFGDIGAHNGGAINNVEEGMDSDSDGDRSPLGLITDKHIEILATGCTLLRDIEIIGCCSLTGSSVVHLLTLCANLQKLSLRSCDALTDCVLPKGGGDSAMMFGLTALELQNCGYVTNQAVRELVACCPWLSDLNLYGCFGLTDDCIGSGDEFAKLQLLNLGNCRVGASGLARVAMAATELRVVIAGDEHAPPVTDGKPATVTDDVMVCLGSHSLHLEHLDVYSSSCSGAGLAMLSSGCDELTAISLSNCPSMTQLAPMQSFPALQSLTVKDSPLGDDDIAVLAQAAPRLGYLCVQSPSSGVTGTALRLISQELRCLHSLCLSGCTGIGNDVTVHPMPRLERLSLYDCGEWRLLSLMHATQLLGRLPGLRCIYQALRAAADALTAVSCLAIMMAAPKLHRAAARTAVTCERCKQLADLHIALPLLPDALRRYCSAEQQRRSGASDDDDSAADRGQDSPHSSYYLRGEPDDGTAGDGDRLGRVRALQAIWGMLSEAAARVCAVGE
jgi:hypothetical protein